MKIMLIGSGAREHALARTLARSTHQPEIFCVANGYNPGIMELTKGYQIGDLCSKEEILELAQKWRINLAVIGPEAPLERGIVDCLAKQHIPSFGPSQALAQIETSKAFARALMQKYQIPGSPDYRVFNGLEGAQDYLRQLGNNQYVIKANGLASGKGVKVAGDHLHSLSEAYQYCIDLTRKGQSFLIEEKMLGQEFSLLCFTDGRTTLPMPLVQDHKRAFIGNKGPNTGGMGSYTAANHRLPYLTEEDFQAALRINELTVQALTEEIGERYQGVIYGGFMATQDGVRLIEFNARFGDPEALNLLTLLESDFVDLCLAINRGDLQAEHVKFAPLATVCKYAVPEGYPDQPHKNLQVDLSAIKRPEQLYIAGLHMMDNKLFTTSSRAAAVVGKAKSIQQAEKIAEEEIKRIKGRLFHREDIGKNDLIQACIRQMQELRQAKTKTAASEPL